MAEAPFWQRFVAAVNREYERRIRAASLVSEYGGDHHGGDEPEGGEVAVIANVPRGTRLRPSSEHRSAEGHEAAADGPAEQSKSPH
ncbi:MAG: hypothetical protein OHK0015_03180 [Chloroflexi bacterium OHK40]